MNWAMQLLTEGLDMASQTTQYTAHNYLHATIYCMSMVTNDIQTRAVKHLISNTDY